MRIITSILAAVLAATASFACANFMFSELQDQCGKAFEGRVVEDSTSDPRWANARLVMHIRDCSDDQLKIPLHMDNDRSRVWIITKLENGQLRLKHDHRHADGTSDAVTMYGGDTKVIDSATSFAFPVDAESIENFKANGLEASVTNVWTLSVDQARQTFHYRLERPGRAFEVVFDLTKPVPVPPPAWDLRG